MQRHSFVMLALVLACDSGGESAKDAKAEDAAPAAKAEAEAKAVAPPAARPPAPEGTVALGKLYVRTCADPHPCPSMKHAEGKAYCEGLNTGGLTWRLPSLAELESWRGEASLTGYDVMHWTGTAWEEDAGQVWIYDPGSGAKTTAPPDRKAFTIRCVGSPG